jgi:hypothetical protein
MAHRVIELDDLPAPVARGLEVVAEDGPRSGREATKAREGCATHHALNAPGYCVWESEEGGHL